jgi:hypothetical protein
VIGGGTGGRGGTGLGKRGGGVEAFGRDSWRPLPEGGIGGGGGGRRRASIFVYHLAVSCYLLYSFFFSEI